ncbi:hypothetical protein BT67DRAFT_448923 [Trichocladium antarcticum]|uniref:Uncharacterized protein n=1 Tax=Trichocladium antarcticum TaxID=1450529 RepID=A0AAN6ULL0_9PEZI|nr:hypothetical protein BT67DRAFT_448923 [Trichocladium antarcticum]
MTNIHSDEHWDIVQARILRAWCPRTGCRRLSAGHSTTESRATLIFTALQASALPATMDDTARLVSELHDKLAALDGKVAAYRRDMLTEFHKHMEDCLQQYPGHVSNEVSRAIAESMSTGRFPALSPATRTPDSPAPEFNHDAWAGSNSPPSFLRHTSDNTQERPRSPHVREKEFHGLFTPTYLPLLESCDPHRSSSLSPPPLPIDTPTLSLSVDNVTKVDKSKQSVSSSPNGRPDPTRRLTDQSTSSAGSSGSDSKVRMSALRRISSNRGSPRRVRFDFQGEEVFPSSSSPLPSPTLAPESGAQPEPEPQVKAEASPIAIENETTAYTGTSLLDVEGEEDWLPRPKKVSSTQALQALTRSPLDEGTVWREVNADRDEPVKMHDKTQTGNSFGRAPVKVDRQAIMQLEDAAEDDLVRNRALGSPIEDLGNYDDDEDGNSSDDEFLSMGPKKKTPPGPSLAVKMPFARPPAQAPAAPAANAEVNGKKDADADQEPFFNLEEEELESRQKYLPEPDDDEDSEIPSGRLKSLALAGEPIPAPENEEEGQGTRIPLASPSAVLFGHSVGSYMGRPITVNPINNPKLYDEIANMKDVQLFVGSIHDHTAAEAADMGSYRAASLARGSVGAPRSFTQRLALEEAMERRRAAGVKDDEA